MYRADKLALQYVESSYYLMQRAAAAVADLAQAILPLEDKAQVLVLCGKGNNGGDGFLAAQLLVNRGYKVNTIFCADPTDTKVLKGDVSRAFEFFSNAGMTIDFYTGSSFSTDQAQDAPELAAWYSELARQADQLLIIDAIFGAGLTRAIEGPVGLLVDAVNGLALDDEYSTRVSAVSYTHLTLPTTPYV